MQNVKLFEGFCFKDIQREIVTFQEDNPNIKIIDRLQSAFLINFSNAFKIRYYIVISIWYIEPEKETKEEPVPIVSA